jgi:hypothetical protein
MKSACFSLATSVVLALALILPATSALAQDHKAEVSGGYQYNHVSQSDCSDQDCSENLNGWYADVSARLVDMFSAVAQVSGGYKSKNESVSERVGNTTVTGTADEKLRLYTYMFGLRLTPKTASSKLSPFVQVLAGAAKVSVKANATLTGGGQSISESFSESHTHGALSLSGGATVWASPRFGVRGTAGYSRVFGSEDENGKLNVFTAQVGIVIPVG